MQTINSNGMWWLPENPANKVAGALRFSDEAGIELLLAGVLGEPAPGLDEKSFPIILGLVHDFPLGSLVSLKDCRVKSVHLGSHGFAREDYFAARLFIGCHLETEKDFLFSELSVSLSGLPSWASVLSGLSYRVIEGADAHHGGFEVRWLSPASISGPIPGGQLSLAVGAELSTRCRAHAISEEVGFNISCDGPQSDDVLNARYVYPLQNLMTLATDHPNALVDFSLRKSSELQRTHVLGARVFRDTGAATDLPPYKMLFSLEDVRDRVIDLIGKWFEISERLSDVCSQYFGIQYKPETFVDVKFLVVFQSLEVYQRKRQQQTSPAVNTSGALLSEQFRQLLEDHRATVGLLFGETSAGAA